MRQLSIVKCQSSVEMTRVVFRHSSSDVVRGRPKPGRNTNVSYPPPRGTVQILHRGQSGCTPTSGHRPASIRESTRESYFSALRCVFLHCASTDAVMVLADRQTAERFSTCFQNEGTQRVYLAAWRKAHVLCTLPWPCGNCPISRELRCHDPSGRSSLAFARKFQCLSPGKPGFEPRGIFAYQFLSPSLLRWKTDQSACILAPCACKGSAPSICADVLARTVVCLWLLALFKCPPGGPQFNQDPAMIRGGVGKVRVCFSYTTGSEITSSALSEVLERVSDDEYQLLFPCVMGRTTLER